MKLFPYLAGVAVTLGIAHLTFASDQISLIPGTLDSSFNPGAGPNNTVYTAVISPDDSIWIGGLFTEVDGQGRNGVARLAPNGALDPGFGSPLSPTDEVHAIAVLPASKGIVAALHTPGGRPGLAFIPPDGATMQRIDFDPSITIRGWGTASSIVVLGDGETVVTADDDGLVFFLPQATGGYIQKRVPAIVMFSSFDRPIGSLTVDGSGRPIAGGGFNQIGGVTQAYLARFLPNGDLDIDFNPQIPYQKPGQMGGLYFRGATAFADGSVIAAKVEQFFRLTSQGVIDVSFDGTHFPDLGSPIFPSVIRNARIVPLTNNYVLVYSFSSGAGDGFQSSHMYRVRPDGSIADGWAVGFSPGGGIQDVTADRRGNVIMVGNFTNVLGRPLRGVARLYGGATNTPPVVPAPPNRIEIREGTDLILANYPTLVADPYSVQWFFGDQSIPDQTSPRLSIHGIRSRQAGPYSLQVTNAFGVTRTPPADVQVIPYPKESGRVDLDFERPVPFGILPEVVARQSDGKWLVAGKWSSPDLIKADQVAPHTLRRLLADGSLDPEFRPSFLKGRSTDNIITALAVQADGKILVGGSLRLNTQEGVGFLVRLQTDGSVDTGFAIDPSLMTLSSNVPPSLILPRLTGIAVQPSGRILCSGTFQSETRPAAFAFQTNGAVDTEYTQRIPFGTSSAVVAMRDGRSVLLGNNFQPPLSVGSLLIRLLADGTLDGSFQSPPQEDYEMWDQIVRVDEDGSCIAARHDWPTGKTRLSHLDSKGTLVATWGEISGPRSGESPPMQSLPDHRVVAAWIDTSTAARPLQLAVFGPRAEDRWEITRTLSTAPPFTPPQSTAYLLGADPEGRVLLGGLFGELDGIPRLGLARLHLGNLATGPSLLRPKRAADRFEVEIETLANQTYELQRAPNLSGSPWTSVVRTTGNGAHQTLADPAATDGAAFYRVRVE